MKITEFLKDNFLFLDGHAAPVSKERANATNSNDWYYGTGKGLE